MLKAKSGEKRLSPATAKMSREAMFEVPPRHFGKGQGAKIFMVASLYPALVISLTWSR